MAFRGDIRHEDTWIEETWIKFDMREAQMKLSIALAATALLATGFTTASTETASAVVYCTYIGYPAGCVVRPGVVLRPRPVARAAAREAVRPGTPSGANWPFV